MAKRPKNETILIIEDEIDIRIFASSVLELEGYRVLQAETGAEGLKLLLETQVHLVLIDLRLPDIHGWEILEQAKSDPATSAIPVIIFTASAGGPQYDHALALGAADLLTKPLSASDLRNAVARNLKLQR